MMPDWVAQTRLRKRKRDLQKKSDNVYQFLESDILKADTHEKRRDIEALRQFLCAQFDEEIMAMESRELVARARRCHIDVSDIGSKPENEDHWVHGVHGAWFLQPKSFMALSEMVEEAEHQFVKARVVANDFWWKFVTAIAAITAAVAAILNLFRH